MAGTVTGIGSSTDSSSLASSLAVTGLASGVDWSSLVQALANAERAPETQWSKQQTTLNSQNSAFSTIASDLTALQTDIQKLQDPSLYESMAAISSDSTIATASATSGASAGAHTFVFSQLATAALISGSSNVSQILAPNGDLSSITVGTAGFSTPLTAGTFTVDGAQVTLSGSDSLQTVFDNIASATNNKVTASYDKVSDTISLASSDNSEIILGSAADTSNFLQVAQLYNTGVPGPITSASPLGHVQVGATLSGADLKTQISDGGGGQGQFAINGVSISYDASTDTLQDVLGRITSSSAGVTATYDGLNNDFVLTNKTTGDIGISMQDVTGNFLAATGLSAGTLQRGQNLQYSVNGGTPLVSQSNTVTSVQGLSVTAQAEGTATVNVSADTSAISSTIQQFITDYNTVQSYITSQMGVTTASDGTVTAGLLTGDQTATEIASSLRSLTVAPVSIPGLSNAFKQLASLGIQTNGQDNTIQLSDSGALTSALTDHLSDVKTLFADSTSGLAAQLNNYINGLIGDNGTLINHQSVLTQRSTDITTQISNLEKTISADTARWNAEFQAMEQAQAQVNQELTYLSQQVANWAKG
jgi:flagellar hook-associated protein 2